mmetsp:Transcript_106748/g.244455  ORF Transcript_106748/g.244455 Transcript_106748/m.244455 type:complete len:259 (-) Transcript_106748:1321-2097(-)
MEPNLIHKLSALGLQSDLQHCRRRMLELIAALRRVHIPWVENKFRLVALASEASGGLALPKSIASVHRDGVELKILAPPPRFRGMRDAFVHLGDPANGGAGHFGRLLPIAECVPTAKASLALGDSQAVLLPDSRLVGSRQIVHRLARLQHPGHQRRHIPLQCQLRVRLNLKQSRQDNVRNPDPVLQLQLHPPSLLTPSLPALQRGVPRAATSRRGVISVPGGQNGDMPAMASEHFLQQSSLSGGQVGQPVLRKAPQVG